MNVRARINGEFYYGEHENPAVMAEFWTVIEGYRRKKVPYEITWSTGMFDRENNEIYSGDKVDIYFKDENRDRSMFPNSKERGTVEFIDGCFIVVNDDGFVWDVGNTFMDELNFAIEIKGNIYEQQNV